MSWVVENRRMPSGLVVLPWSADVGPLLLPDLVGGRCQLSVVTNFHCGRLSARQVKKRQKIG